MDENLIDFEQWFIPLLKAAKERGLTYRVEQCPMPGWTTGDIWHNNIAYTPGAWIALHRICEKHGVGDNFRIHYDPSHAILMGQDTRSIFQYLKDEGYNFLIGGFHVKGQVADAKGWSAWGSGGQTMERGDWKDGKPSPNPADQANAWKKQVVLGEHELPGTARHDPLAYLQNRSVDWLDHQLAARELLKLDVANTHLVVEHEYPKARIQDKERLKPILQGSIAFVRHIDEAAACMYALQHEVLGAQKIPIQGVGRQAYRCSRSCRLPAQRPTYEAEPRPLVVTPVCQTGQRDLRRRFDMTCDSAVAAVVLCRGLPESRRRSRRRKSNPASTEPCRSTSPTRPSPSTTTARSRAGASSSASSCHTATSGARARMMRRRSRCRRR